MREFPTNERYKTSKNKKLLYRHEKGSAAHIDIVIERGGRRYGLEFYLGTDTDEGWYFPKEGEEECYYLKSEPFDINYAKIHFENDLEKLSNSKNMIDEGYVVCFFRHWWGERKKDLRLEKKEKTHRKKLDGFIEYMISRKSEKIIVKIIGKKRI